VPAVPLRVLALDFDGVISDSAPEAFLVALRTFAGLRPGCTVADSAAAFAGAAAPAVGALRGSPLYQPFLALMPLGNRAEDYGVVLSALGAGTPVPDQAAYDALRDRHDPAWLADFHRRFYEERHALAASDPTGWLRLMPPYRELLPLLRRWAGAVELAIATARDRRSVEALLRAYGIGDVFAPERILDKQTGVAKTAHLAELRTRCAVEFKQITFVDDKVSHLDGAAALGVRCGFATWGYNGPREMRQAEQRGHLVCGIRDVERQVFGGELRPCR
jgi:phosphoglycolate phosphatase-like HAD superfamily hydrolase